VTWYFDPASYQAGSAIYIAQGGWSPSVAQYVVKKVTPSGQIVAHMCGNEASEIRINKRGNIVGEGSYGRRCVVGLEEAIEIRKDLAIKHAWNCAAVAGEAIEKAARNRNEAALADAMKALAQAIEARRAATGTGAVHESAVAESDAP
jgi:hypothetical protein